MTITLSHRRSELESDLETPVSLFLSLVKDRKGILLESAEPDGRWGRYSLIATDIVLSLTCRQGKLEALASDQRLHCLLRHSGKNFMDGLRQVSTALHFSDPDPAGPPITRALYGYLGYGVAGLLEPKLAASVPAEEAEATLFLPGTIILFDHRYNRITNYTLTCEHKTLQAISEFPPVPHTPRARGRLAEFTAFSRAVERSKETIAQGGAVQIVLSVPFSAPLEDKPFTIYRRLRRRNPSPYLFYMNLPDGILLGSSPEVMVRCENNILTMCPIAGTSPRSSELAEDALFGDELLHNQKERAEHAMLVDLATNDLGRIAKTGTVNVERFMELEYFSHVMHLCSRVCAELDPRYGIVDILGATFPVGTVSGAPKIRAMECISAEEALPRGPYAGAIGWIGLDKNTVNLDFGITIRSLWIRGQEVHWQAGAGIVYDSLAEAEWRECHDKAAVIAETLSLKSSENKGERQP